MGKMAKNFEVKKAFIAYIHDTKSSLDPTYRIQEDRSLAHTLDIEIIDDGICYLRRFNPATFMGKGWVEKIKQYVTTHHLDLVIIDPDITPLQHRNLEKEWKCRVLDRTALILEIFAKRARSSEGQLQVQLARLLYQKSRLVRIWTHLERQRGALGFIGGPGETQIEIDRRLIQEKINRIKKDLEKVKKTRSLQRHSRQKVPYPVIALVGYTNAGKSTLFNQLTHAHVQEKDELFATLDPTMRRLVLPSKRMTILSDTVGFISELPELLVTAFQATLEEVKEADLLVHVRDISHPHTETQKQAVLAILKKMNCTIPVIEVLNKSDLLTENEKNDLCSKGKTLISATKGEGIPLLLEKIDMFFDQKSLSILFRLPSDEGKSLAWLYTHSHVLSMTLEENFILMKSLINPDALARFKSLFPKIYYSSANSF